MNDDHEFLSIEKKQDLEDELNILKTTKRQEILDRLDFAKSLGDLSENAEYHTSKDDQGKNEARIAQIETILKDAIIVEANTDGIIGLGSIVVLVKKETLEEKTYTLVGNEEADFSAGKISFSSPIGLAVLNKKVGDSIVVITPRGETIYSIKEVY